MKPMIILIVMFFSDPMRIGADSVTIETYNGKPLLFYDQKKCSEWIWKDLENLKAYAKSVYPDAVAIKEILCVYRKEEI